MNDPALTAESPDWLRPSVALTRFKLGDTKLALGGAMELKPVRYGVRVGGLRILLPGNTVSEVLDSPQIFPVPNTTSWLDGLINLRGNVVTVIDTRKRFNLMSVDTTDSSRIVIIEVDGQEIGMMVDSVAEVVDLPVSGIESAPNIGNEGTARYIQGVTSIEGRLLILIDVNKFLESDEFGDASGF